MECVYKRSCHGIETQAYVGDLKPDGLGAGIFRESFEEDQRLGVRIGPSHKLEFFMQKRRVDDPTIEAAGTDDRAGIVDQARRF